MMNRDERQRLRAAADEVEGWVNEARDVSARRGAAHQAGDEASHALRKRVNDVPLDGRRAWRALPLGVNDGANLRAIALRANLPAVTPDEQVILDGLGTSVATAVQDARAVLGAGRFFASRSRRDSGTRAAGYPKQNSLAKW